MSVVYFILLILVSVFALCSIVSVVQFFIDLHKNSSMRKELKDTIKRIKEQNKAVLNDAGGVSNDENN